MAVRGSEGTLPAPPDDVVSLLHEDHQRVRQRLYRLEAAAADGRSELFWKLTDALVRHEVAEEMVVYPFLRGLPAGQPIAEARIAEQATVEQQLADMEQLDPVEHDFDKALAQLRASVLEHMDREETEAIPLLSGAGSSEELVALGQRYLHVRDGAPHRPHPHAPDTPPGNVIARPVAVLADQLRDLAHTI